MRKEHTDPWREKDLKRDIAQVIHAAAAASDDKSVKASQRCGDRMISENLVSVGQAVLSG